MKFKATLAITTALIAVGISSTAATAYPAGCTKGACVNKAADDHGLTNGLTSSLVNPTASEMSAIADEDAAEGIQSSTPVRCYNNQGWEYWTTRAGHKIWWLNHVHWCGRALIHLYKSTVSGSEDWSLPTLWDVDSHSWVKGWLDTTHKSVRATASGSLNLRFGGQVLENLHAILCVDMFANGNVKVSCSN